jgi:hypothetical protein
MKQFIVKKKIQGFTEQVFSAESQEEAEKLAEETKLRWSGGSRDGAKNTTYEEIIVSIKELDAKS